MKFANLHCHTNIGSPYDALYSPKDFFMRALEKGMDSVAITEHGNLNSLAEAYISEKEIRGKKDNFKYIKGIEFYYVDDINVWEENMEYYSSNKDKMSNDEYSGILFDIKQRKHLVVWARNVEGLKNLYKMVSISHTKPYFYHRPRIDWNLLSAHSSGLCASSACVEGVLSNLAFWKMLNGEVLSEEDYKLILRENRKFKELFGEYWFGELQWHNFREQNVMNEMVIRSCKELRVPLITTCDSHYLDPQDEAVRNLYRATRYGDGNEDDGSDKQRSIDLSLKNGEEVWNDFMKYGSNWGFDEGLVRESVENTVYVASLMEDFEIDTTPKMPYFILKRYGIESGETTKEKERSIIFNLCMKSLEEKGLDGNDVYKERLNRELDLIVAKDFVKYFLTMKEIVEEAKKHMGVGVGRGSAAGSLVSFLLGITAIDPIRFNLSFSRFLTYDSSGYPDIDFDCARPKELKDILIKNWGENRIIFVSNWNLLSFKTATKDIAKYFGVNFSEVNEMTKKALIEYRYNVEEEDSADPSIDEVLAHSVTAREFFKNYPQVGMYVDKLKGSVRDLGTHAGGVIVGDDLFSEIPVIRVKDKYQTPWPEGQGKRLLEQMGFIKFDILGIVTIQEIMTTIRKVMEQKGMQSDHASVYRYYEERFLPYSLSEPDKNVFKHVFSEGNFVGVFQFSNGGAQRFCMDFSPKNILELAIVTSVYRPGPLGANVHQSIVSSKNGVGAVQDYGCMEFAEVTKDTYGFLIFQEQISELYSRVTGVSEDESQKVRKLLTKKKGGDQEKLEPYRKLFFEKMVERGHSVERVEQLWNVIQLFSGYGFNKSHAVSYAVLSYQCALLSYYYKEQWLSSVLDTEYEMRGYELISSLLSSGYRLALPSFFDAGSGWKIEKGDNGHVIIPPFSVVNGITEETAKLLVSVRDKIKNLFDFYVFCLNNKRLMRKNVIQNLVNAGFLNDFFQKEKIGQQTFLNFLETNKKPIFSSSLFYEKLSSLFGNTEFFTVYEMAKKIYNNTGLFYADLFYSKEGFIFKKFLNIMLPSKMRDLENGETITTFCFVDKIFFSSKDLKVFYYDESGQEKSCFLKNTTRTAPLEKRINIFSIKKSNYSLVLNDIYVL